MTETLTPDRVDEIRAAAPPYRRRVMAVGTMLAAAVALVPPVLMLRRVRSSSELQWLDYWEAFASFTSSTGETVASGFAYFGNEHPLFVPSVIYWANIHLTGGSNRALGVLSAGITLAIIVLLWRMLPDSRRSRIVAAPALVLMSALLFSPNGMHNYVLGMSGVAWLLANLFTLVAIRLALSDRLLLAAVAGVLASASYGTGLMVWAALAVVLTVGRRWSLRAAPLAVTGIVCVVLFAVHYFSQSSASIGEGSLFTLPYRLLRSVAIASSSLWTDSTTVGAVVGGLTLAGAAIVIVIVLRRHDVTELPLLGVLAYSGAALVMAAAGRLRFEDQNLLASRYASVPALFWIAVIVLAWRVHGLRRVAAGAGAIAIVLASVTAGPESNYYRSLTLYQDEVSVALRLGDVSAYWYPISPPFEELIPRMQAVGHYPFTDRFDEGCGGYLDEVVPGDDVAHSDVVRGSVDHLVDESGQSVRRLSGWVDAPALRCVVIANASGRIAGVGIAGHGRPDVEQALGRSGNFGWIAATRIEPGVLYDAFAVLQDDELYYTIGTFRLPVPEPVRPAEGPARL